MKAFRIILAIIASLLIVPLGIVATAGAMWFTLPMIETTIIGTTILKVLTEQWIFWITIGSAILYVVLQLLQSIFNRDMSAKVKNFFIHLNTWTMGLVAIALAVATFVLVNPLTAEEVIITMPKKITIGIGIISLALFHIFSGKVSKIVNRKIQAYDTSKEMNTVGRSSVVSMNILKLLEILFPELIVLVLLCMCVSINVSIYFLVALTACLVPVFGNIVCDFNTRHEIKRNAELEKDKMAEKISNNMRGM